jgi:ubiquilin
MSGLLENPEALRAMMMANPQMRQMVECNPELGHILNDPAVLRQSLETTRNPELRREMQRNTDRAISNMEMMPEGFNMLRRMYSTYQQPLDSVSPSCFMSSASADGGHTAAPPSAQASPNTSALPNPWQPQPQQPVAPTHQAPPANWMVTPPGATQIPIQSALPPRQQQTPNPQSQQQPASSIAQAQQILQRPAALAGALATDPASQALLSANPEMAGFLGRPDFLQRLATNVAQANGMAAGAGASPPVQATTSSACSHVGPRPADAADASKACKGGCGFFRSAGSEYCSKCKP